MKTIYKYQLEPTDVQMVVLPRDAQILSVQAQDGSPKLWALVDPEEDERRSCKILCVGTGHPREDLGGARFLGTVQLQGGVLVFHFFEGV